jgi:hypothetical protein
LIDFHLFFGASLGKLFSRDVKSLFDLGLLIIIGGGVTGLQEVAQGWGESGGVLGETSS